MHCGLIHEVECWMADVVVVVVDRRVPWGGSPVTDVSVAFQAAMTGREAVHAHHFVARSLLR